MAGRLQEATEEPCEFVVCHIAEKLEVKSQILVLVLDLMVAANLQEAFQQPADLDGQHCIALLEVKRAILVHEIVAAVRWQETTEISAAVGVLGMQVKEQSKMLWVKAHLQNSLENP